MFVLHDASSNQLFASRDPIGVRPGFIGTKEDELVIASEAKPLVQLCETVCLSLPELGGAPIRQRHLKAILPTIVLLSGKRMKMLFANRSGSC